MGVAILRPHDCFNDLFSRNNHASPHMKYPKAPSSCPNRQRKPVNNRRRRSPPRHQDASPPPLAPPPPPPSYSVSSVVSKGSKKKNPSSNNKIVAGQVRILKRGEDIGKKSSDLTGNEQDLGSTSRIGPDPEKVSAEIRLSVPKSKPALFYAGPVTMTSPPPSDVPVPAFFAKKSISVFKAADATNDLIRILRLDIA